MIWRDKLKWQVLPSIDLILQYVAIVSYNHWQGRSSRQLNANCRSKHDKLELDLFDAQQIGYSSSNHAHSRIRTDYVETYCH